MARTQVLRIGAVVALVSAVVAVGLLSRGADPGSDTAAVDGQLAATSASDSAPEPTSASAPVDSPSSTVLVAVAATDSATTDASETTVAGNETTLTTAVQGATTLSPAGSPAAGSATTAPSPTEPATSEPSTTTTTTTTTTAAATTPTTAGSSGGGGGFPANVAFDYQIGSPYSPPAGVGVVSRDWSSGQPLDGGSYSICYVNAFQTQPDGSGGRIDEQSNWPSDVVLTSLGDDPNWEGEFLIDLSTGAKRSTAAAHVAKMVDSCAAKGFDAVEFDNLDSWTRIPGLPFGRSDAIAFAKLITDHAHNKGLAVAQKNTVGLSSAEAKGTIGFDFAIVESCGQYNECDVVAGVYGPDALYIEYSDQAFNSACQVVGGRSSVVRRNRSVSAPGSGGYVYDEC